MHIYFHLFLVPPILNCCSSLLPYFFVDNNIMVINLPMASMHMYVAGSGLQCPSPVQLDVVVALGNKPFSQVKVMDDPSNVVV